MNTTRFVAGALAYLVLTFPLAAVWHVVAFKDTYDQLGYFGRDEPSFALGFLAILVQGVVLSGVYPWFPRGSNPVRDGLRFGGVVGCYHWTGHVVAAAAKHPIAPLTTWFAIETAYLALQFGITGVAIAMIYGPVAGRTPKADAPM